MDFILLIRSTPLVSVINTFLTLCPRDLFTLFLKPVDNLFLGFLRFFSVLTVLKKI